MNCSNQCKVAKLSMDKLLAGAVRNLGTHMPLNEDLYEPTATYSSIFSEMLNSSGRRENSLLLNYGGIIALCIRVTKTSKRG